MSDKVNDKQILGWREWIGFPNLGIPQVKAKVDTGARTSCLHAFLVETFEREGEAWVHFDMHPIQGNTDHVLHCEAPLLERRIIRDSGGHEEMRYVIETTVRVGDSHQLIEVTLTDRDNMKFRALLGRSAISGRYMVDCQRSYVQGKRNRLRKRQNGR
jgi:hypothetical protein